MTEETTEPGAELPEYAAPEGRRNKRLAQLEEALERETEESNRLRSELRELTFRLDILERSYSKQLADERARGDAAEKRVAEHGVRIAELDSAREDSIELLTEARTELDRLNAERDQLRRKLGVMSDSPGAGLDDPYADEGTINTLLDDSGWSRNEKPEPELIPGRGLQTEATDDDPSEELISPDLVFASGSHDD